MGDEMDIAFQIIVCVLGTLGFAITMNAPKGALLYISIGALISASIERILSPVTNDFISCLSAMVVLSLYCEIISRIIKEPTTITLMPATIPLLPGSSIFYTMLYAINGDSNLMVRYATSTLFAGLGIALGAIISSALVKIVMTIKRKQFKKE